MNSYLGNVKLYSTTSNDVSSLQTSITLHSQSEERFTACCFQTVKVRIGISGLRMWGYWGQQRSYVIISGGYGFIYYWQDTPSSRSDQSFMPASRWVNAWETLLCRPYEILTQYCWALKLSPTFRNYTAQVYSMLFLESENKEIGMSSLRMKGYRSRSWQIIHHHRWWSTASYCSELSLLKIWSDDSDHRFHLTCWVRWSLRRTDTERMTTMCWQKSLHVLDFPVYAKSWCSRRSRDGSEQPRSAPMVALNDGELCFTSLSDIWRFRSSRIFSDPEPRSSGNHSVRPATHSMPCGPCLAGLQSHTDGSTIRSRHTYKGALLNEI